MQVLKEFVGFKRITASDASSGIWSKRRKYLKKISMANTFNQFTSEYHKE